jgi:hypothetical protein
MTMLNASPSAKGKRVKFTPQAMENIKEFVAQGISRDEIVKGRTIPAPGSVGIAHVREQQEVSQPVARAAPLAKFEIMMRCRGKEQAIDIPLSTAVIEALALEAMSRDLDIAGLVGQILVSAINKDMIHKIFRD